MATLNNGFLAAEISPLGASLNRLYVSDVPVAERGDVHGRFANRIGCAEFTLDGETYHLKANEGRNILHGGPEGFAKRIWEEAVESDTAVKYSLVSEDGDQGFPGTMQVEVRYTLEDDALRLDYYAICDKKTVVNLTNHAFFNLNGLETGTLHHAHTLTISADGYLETDCGLIPTGNILPTKDTRFDYCCERIFVGNYDNCFVLNINSPRLPIAVLRGLESGINMEVYTNLPGLQVYNTSDRICLETQELPDAVHHENFPSCVLEAGHKYKSTTIYRFICEK